MGLEGWAKLVSRNSARCVQGDNGSRVVANVAQAGFAHGRAGPSMTDHGVDGSTRNAVADSQRKTPLQLSLHYTRQRTAACRLQVLVPEMLYRNC